MRNEDLEALKKLDEAIQALKEAGYKFSCHSIVETEVAGRSYGHLSKRHIELRCYKKFPIAKNEEGIRELANFRGDPNP